MLLRTPKREGISGIRRLWGQRHSTAEGSTAENIVWRRHLPEQVPSSPIAQSLYAVLAQRGPIPVDTLAKIVADSLYDDELRRGASVLDIGMLGARLFENEVLRELHAGNGIFWDIGHPEKTV